MDAQRNDDYCKKNSHNTPIRFSKNLIAVYTVLRILLKMRQTLGLEAMIEYIDCYLKVIESSNQEFKIAVTQALKHVNIQKIYDDAFK